MTALIEIANQTFGRLTVLRRAADRVYSEKRAETRFLCRCDCGLEVIVPGIKLRNGKVKHCGDQNRHSLINETIGYWTVMEEVPPTRTIPTDERLYRCYCTCGTERVIGSNQLRTKRGQSCGCRQSNLDDLTGQRFNYWTVVERVEDHIAPSGKRAVRYLCQCTCGNMAQVLADVLRSGNSQSCGCFARERSTKHGFAGKRGRNPTYNIWATMIARCHNPNNKSYPNYGGCGITVYEPWHNFENFLADMGERPSTDLSIDRINPWGNYEPSNCRWAERSVQNKNRRITGDYNLDWVLNTCVQYCAARKQSLEELAHIIVTQLSPKG